MLVESSVTIIPVDSIHIHKINVITPLKKQVTQYTDIANQTPESLPTVRLGRIHDKLYGLADFDVIHGVKNSRLTETACSVVDFKSEVDFIIQHVKLNKNPTGFNQFSLFQVINYMNSQNIPKEQAIKLLQINQINHHKLLHLDLHPNVIEQLSDFHDYLSEKLTHFSIPYYLSEIISRFEKSKQIQITKDAIELVKTHNMSESRFSWPAIEEFQIFLGKPDENKSTLIIPDNVKPSTKQMEIANNIVNTSKNVICIPGDGTHPSYLINKKTNTVSTINDKDTITTINETASQKIYALPPNIVKYLKLEEADKPLKIKKFSNSSDLISYLKKDSELQGVVLFK